MALINKLSAIGDAIRAKTGRTEKLTLDQMPDAINSITSGSSGGGSSNISIISGQVIVSSSRISFVGADFDFTTNDYNISIFFSFVDTQGIHHIIRKDLDYINKVAGNYYVCESPTPGKYASVNSFLSTDRSATSDIQNNYTTNIIFYHDYIDFVMRDGYTLDTEFIPFIVIKE